MIAAGSGAVVTGKALPESWSKPVIDAVMLPAHAETTDDTGSEGGELTTTQACCLTADKYCGPSMSTGGSEASYGPYIEIIVAADGGIQVVVFYGCDNYSGASTIPCIGGGFTVTAERQLNGSGCAPQEGTSGDVAQENPNSIQVTGTVNCGATIVEGAFSILESAYSYQASNEDCKKPA